MITDDIVCLLILFSVYFGVKTLIFEFFLKKLDEQITII